MRQREAYLQTAEPEAAPEPRHASLPAGPLTPAAVVALQRSAGNRAVAAMVARQAPAAAAVSPDPTLIGFLDHLWQDSPGNAIRLGLELFRPIPVLGALPGLGSDVIEMGQDLFSVPVGDPVLFGITEMTLMLRSGLNIASGGVAQVLAISETIQAVAGAATLLEALSVIGVPESLLTAAFTGFITGLDEALGADKLSLTTLVALLDFIITIEAAAGAVLGPVADSEAWTDLMGGYIANQFEDMMSIINDGLGLATLELSQSGKIDGLIGALAHFAQTVGPGVAKIQEWIIGFWNVLGGDAVDTIGVPDLRPAEPVGLEPTDPQPGGATIGFVARAAAPDDGWLAARGIELDAMRACVQTGDAILAPIAEQVGELVSGAGQMAEDAVGGHEGVVQLRENLTSLLGDVETRLGAVAGLEEDAGSASEQLGTAREGIAGGIEYLETLTLPALDLGTAADAIIQPALDQIDGVLEVAKQAALEPLREVLAGLDRLDELLAAVLTAAGLVGGMLQDAVAQIEAALAGCESLPEMLQAIIDQCVALTSAGEATSFEDLHDSWTALGPQVEEAAAAAR